MSFRPTLIPTAFMIFGVALTWSLGFWQLGRHQTKSELRDAILAGLDGPVATATDLSRGDADLTYRKIEVEGIWVEPVALMAGRKEIGRVGYGLVQPLRLETGELLLVDRGWVPRDGLDEALTEVDGTGAQVTVRGQLRPVDGEPDRRALPSADGLERWPPGSWPALWARLPDPKLDAIVLAGEPILVGGSKRTDRLPIDGYQPLPRMTDSLSYAFQWWIFGAILIVVWGFLSLRRAPAAK